MAIYTSAQVDNFDLLSLSVSLADLGDFNPQDFVVETLSAGTKVIYTNVEDAVLLYLVDVTDTTKFDTLFELALARLLASFLAGPIIKGTEGMKVGATHREFFEKVDLPQAISADSNARQSSPYDTVTPAPIRARE